MDKHNAAIIITELPQYWYADDIYWSIHMLCSWHWVKWLLVITYDHILGLDLITFNLSFINNRKPRYLNMRTCWQHDYRETISGDLIPLI